MLAHGGDLFLGVPPGVYRLRDANGDGTIDTRTPISEGYNIHPAFGGHGISGVTLGPDGRLYWEVGDMGLNVVDKTGRRWAYPNQGAVLRSNLDGSGFEVFATGIRNLEEFSFDELGNLISVDNDGDHAGETERLVYIPEGSDSGWRSNWQYGKYTDEQQQPLQRLDGRGDVQAALRRAGRAHRPADRAVSRGAFGHGLQPGHGAVRGVAKSFPGHELSRRGRQRARLRVPLKEDGAGFALDRDTVLLRGILAVGMKFGPDGALYLTDWITGWRSKNSGRLWKLDATAGVGRPGAARSRDAAPADFSTRAAGRPRAAAAARGHAHPAQGAVRAGAPGRRADAARRVPRHVASARPRPRSLGSRTARARGSRAGARP